MSEPVAWLESLIGPVRACYEAGPTGFGLYRAAVASGIDMQVIAPSKTPRGPSDRVKTDRRDAELLARCLLAGSLKMLLRHGIVYPEQNTWSQEHRRWLARRQFEHQMSALVFADLVARVDG